ncbi:host-nuclease inhibitor Gam family protein [Neisseriaceae bacterium B1]
MIQAYAEQHRQDLTNNGKTQTVKLLSGSLKWRKKPASIQIDGELSQVLAELRRRKLARFIRVKEEINKTALLAKRPIHGIAIADGGETFSIEITP